VPTLAPNSPAPAISVDAPVAARRSPLARLFALAVIVAAVATLGACSPPAGSSGRGGQIVNMARTHLNQPYVYGAAGPGAFDCSGLVQYVHGQVGIAVPRTTGSQLAAARPVAKSSASPGDVIFIGNYHVGIYVGGGQMIDAPHSGSVVQQRSIWTSDYTVGRFY
jgi:cell wall-associated NlpC family hydrolase